MVVIVDSSPQKTKASMLNDFFCTLGGNAFPAHLPGWEAGLSLPVIGGFSGSHNRYEWHCRYNR
jgi:hypothetical protein